MAKTRKTSPAKAFLEATRKMRGRGVLGPTAYPKITKRHLDPEDFLTTHPLSAKEIRSLRARSGMSQAVFAHYLNVTGLCFAVGAGRKAADGAGPGAFECHPAQGHRSNSLGVSG